MITIRIFYGRENDCHQKFLFFFGFIVSLTYCQDGDVKRNATNEPVS